MGSGSHMSVDSLDILVGEIRAYIERAQAAHEDDPSWKDRMRSKGEELAAKMSAAAAEKRAAASDALRTLTERMQAYAAAMAESPNVKALKEKREALARSYEEWLLELQKREGARAAALASSRQLKPTNYVRNAFHALNATTAVTLYHFFLTRESALWVLGILAGIFGTLEITRRFSDRWNDFLVDKVFGSISRPSERYRVNSATLYLIALVLITYFFPKAAVEAAILVLGYGDPFASVIGKKFGQKKLFRDKSYAGTLAFFSISAVAVGVWLFLFAPDMTTLRWAGVTVLIAAVGAVTELLSTRVDDNFSIPIACAAAGALLL